MASSYVTVREQSHFTKNNYLEETTLATSFNFFHFLNTSLLHFLSSLFYNLDASFAFMIYLFREDDQFAHVDLNQNTHTVSHALKKETLMQCSVCNVD